MLVIFVYDYSKKMTQYCYSHYWFFRNSRNDIHIVCVNHSFVKMFPTHTIPMTVNYTPPLLLEKVHTPSKPIRLYQIC